MLQDREFLWLNGIVLGLLSLGSIIGFVLSRQDLGESAKKVVANLNARMRGWWAMTFVFLVSMFLGPTGAVLLFAFMSFLALREFLTLAPTAAGDHRALVWAFFVVVPIHYLVLWTGWYGLFAILIPVYVFLILPIRAAAAGETERFLERTSIIQWALMICVYCVSHAPAIRLLLPIPDDKTHGGKLLMFFVVVCELCDVLQYAFGKLFGKHPVAPTVSPGKTWEGLIGGVVATVLIGAGLWWVTPFSPLQAAGMSLAIGLMGFGGGLVMSAIKRDRGVKDWGSSIAGHGGMLDRIDSLCFAAPVFFHLTRYYFVP